LSALRRLALPVGWHPRTARIALQMVRVRSECVSMNRRSTPAATRSDREEQRDVRIVDPSLLRTSRPILWRKVRDLEHRVDAEPERSQRIDVVGDRSVVRPGRPSAWHRIEWHRHRAQVAIDPAIRELASLVVAPARVARLAEGRVGHDDHDPGARSKDPVKGRCDQLEIRYVGDAQEEDRGVEASRRETTDEVQPSGIADQEAGRSSSALLGALDEAPTRVDPGVAGTSLEDERGEDALPRADIEDLLTGPWRKEFQGSRDRQSLVVGAPALADPAVVPARDVIPTRISPRRSPSGTTLVPGHGGRTDTWAWPSLIGGYRSYPDAAPDGKEQSP